MKQTIPNFLLSIDYKTFHIYPSTAGNRSVVIEFSKARFRRTFFFESLVIKEINIIRKNEMKSSQDDNKARYNVLLL